MKATSTRRETSGPRRDYAKLHAGSMRASPGTTQALAEQAFEVLSSGGANSQKEAAAMMGINEKAVSRVKLKTKAPYTKCHTGSTQTVELELGVTWTKELSYGDSKAERGEAQARAERNYKRKRAALAEVARRRAAEDCGGGALSEPMDEAEEDASRRESALPVNSARWALEPCSSCHLVPFGPHRLQLEGEPEPFYTETAPAPDTEDWRGGELSPAA